ncbi:MAG: DUF998 domain-containing protein [Thermoplasmata archaeon]|nr:DUF998 domain-containing protein [Thermoplasmata archaeon]
MDPRTWPLGCKAGVALIVIYLAFTLSSWALFPTPYGPKDNWLSDLGNYEYNPDGALLYNLGCILTGAAGIIFVWGLRVWWTEERARTLAIKAAQALGLAACVFLICIGIFSEDFPPYHGIFSVAFFLTFGVFILVFIPSVFTHPLFMKPVGAFGLASLAIDISFGAVSGEPIMEWTTVFGFLALVGLLVLNILRMPQPSRD